MVPTIKICVQEMIQKLDLMANNNEEFDIHKLMEGLTMDIIHRTAFGIKTDIQKNSKSQLIEASRAALAAKTSEFLASLLLCLPEFSWIINIIRDINEKISDYFELTSDQILWKSVEAIVDKRIENYKNDENYRKPKDILSLMIDVIDDKINEISVINFENNSEKSLTKVEIIANAIGINEAAFESPANNLAFVIHHLVNYPDIQEKLIEEVDNLYNEDGVIDYNAIVSKMPFTEAVIQETFRLVKPIIDLQKIHK
jgi:cytochrome P450 family 3 subfamily A